MKKLLLLIIWIASSVAIAKDKSIQELYQMVGTDPTVEINLGPTMLGLLTSATSSDNEKISKLLSSLKSIKVTVFELDGDSKIASIKSKINQVADFHIESGLEKIASIKEDDSLVYIFAQVEDEKFKSINITALDDESELVVIHIGGSILVSDIGALLEHFDIDVGIDDL